MSFFLVTPFQIVFVGKSLGEVLAQVLRASDALGIYWEGEASGCVCGEASITKGTVMTAVGSPLGVSPLRSFIVGVPET